MSQVRMRGKDKKKRKTPVNPGSVANGLSGTPEYRCWRAMMVRCYYKRCKGYRWYGGRGIVVCERWRNSCRAFVEDMGPRPGPEYSIDRYPDNDGNYEPGNCRWATVEQQASNRSDNVRFTAFGRTQTISEWGRECGVTVSAIRFRIDNGWPLEKALGAQGKQAIKGAAHKLSKLTADDVRRIRAECVVRGAKRRLAREYGVSTTLITNIVKRKTWAHVA